jgi:biopolymer transport protein ExbB/TolQ
MSDPNPYAPPNIAAEHRQSSNIRLRRIRWVSGAIIPVALVAGVLRTVYRIIYVFHLLAQAQKIVNPRQVAGDISDAIMEGAIAIPVAGIAFCVWMWATVRLRRMRTLETTERPDPKS